MGQSHNEQQFDHQHIVQNGGNSVESQKKSKKKQKKNFREREKLREVEKELYVSILLKILDLTRNIFSTFKMLFDREFQDKSNGICLRRGTLLVTENQRSESTKIR
jgi:hypothetical protein